jgi:DNA-binding SARP family transcriptional activator
MRARIQRTHSLIAEELGVDPSPQTMAAYEAVLRLV